MYLRVMSNFIEDEGEEDDDDVSAGDVEFHSHDNGDDDGGDVEGTWMIEKVTFRVAPGRTWLGGVCGRILSSLVKLLKNEERVLRRGVEAGFRSRDGEFTDSQTPKPQNHTSSSTLNLAFDPDPSSLQARDGLAGGPPGRSTGSRLLAGAGERSAKTGCGRRVCLQ